MKIGTLPSGDPGVFRSLLLPEAAAALSRKEPLTAFGVTQDDTAIGAIAGYLSDENTFLILYLYVAPDYRRCGGGRLLVDTLAQSLQGNAHSIEMRFTCTEPEHETLFPFLEVLGFLKEEDNGETLYLIDLDKTLKRPFFKADGNIVGVPFSQLTEQQITSAAKSAQLAAAPMPQAGLHSETIEKEISMAYVKEGTVLAYVIFDTTWSQGLTLSAAWSDAQNPTILALLLRSAAIKIREKYPLQTLLALQAVTPFSASLIQYLLPEAENISYTYYKPLNTRF